MKWLHIKGNSESGSGFVAEQILPNLVNLIHTLHIVFSINDWKVSVKHGVSEGICKSKDTF